LFIARSIGGIFLDTSVNFGVPKDGKFVKQVCSSSSEKEIFMDGFQIENCFQRYTFSSPLTPYNLSAALSAQANRDPQPLTEPDSSLNNHTVNKQFSRVYPKVSRLSR
jgi:hypothetical protein